VATGRPPPRLPMAGSRKLYPIRYAIRQQPRGVRSAPGQRVYIMSRVFISYRRADSATWATRLYNHLSMRFGKDLIFHDVDSIKPGARWRETLRRELEASPVTLILIGPSWVVDARGNRRLEDPGDVLRMEVEEAISTGDTVIPVLVGGARMPSSEDLPGPLSPLREAQALVMRDNTWIPDVETLIERLRELILPSPGALSLPDALQELDRMQLRYFALLEDQPAVALDLAQKTQRYLDGVMPLYPQDPGLKLTRGYLFKNEAMALDRLGRRDEFAAALKEGERIFLTMIEERPKDAGAWNGLGSIQAVEGNYEEALVYIQKALEIYPDYEAALHDLREVRRALADRDGVGS
jgi:hypothetical protein